MWDFTYWIFTFMLSLVCFGIELFYMFSHEDLDDGYREPYEISEALFKYTPIEILCQVLITFLSLIFFKPLPLLYNAGMTYYNFITWRRSRYAQHFITRREYSKRDYIERTIKYKLVFYMISVFFTLVFAVI